jgi:hypothetical protein
LFVIFHKTSDSVLQSTELTRGPPELVHHFRL